MYLRIFIALLVLGCGSLIMARTFGSTRELFCDREATCSKYLISSALSGLSICLILVGIMLGFGALDTTHRWTPTELIGLITLGIIVGLIVVAGSLWQFSVAGKFREALYRWLQKRRGK